MNLMDVDTTTMLIMAALLVWTLPWKGYALWLAARRGEKWWFIALLIINTLAILEIMYIFGIAKRDGGKRGPETARWGA